MNGCEDESEKSRDLDKDAMDTDDADFEYIVERIVDRRRNKDFIEYKVKWKGTDESKNTWEAADDLDCEELINSFESELRAERNEKRRKRLNGELEPNILGCTRKGDSLWYLIQWKGTDKKDLVAKEIVYDKFPQVVIKFFEDRVKWHDR